MNKSITNTNIKCNKENDILSLRFQSFIERFGFKLDNHFIKEPPFYNLADTCKPSAIRLGNKTPTTTTTTTNSKAPNIPNTSVGS